ncbi:NAD(P)/FAD-dependent oxidoreductase [Levilactobacillus brevis]|uniref:NAD(P)/FAD-dependent oxidoreductase n=1 Tax=Levilactobacillus brevis TaxID=1580 RepID=UPI001BA4EB6A|nr:FAD-dependent oxidoreductase [Levilactobacillus brevis]MBS1014232.1 FAD-dependent oxidoreductase [Levilactobacillus brevis]
MKLLVVGSSHGGRAAITAALAQDATIEIDLIEAGPVTTVYPTQVKVHANMRAIQLLATQHQLLISHAGQKQRLSYDKLILAPGAQATIPAVLSTTSQNVLPMRTRAQINHLKAAATDATIHHVIVIGGGYIGVGAADLFSQHGKQVTLIEHGPQLLGSYLDNDFSMPIQQALQQQGVTVHVNELVTGLTGAPDVTGVTTNQTTLSADLVVVATGTTPNTDWLKGTLDCLPNGLIKTDAYLQTSATDVFAVGDAIAVTYLPQHQSRSIALASNAQRQGELAALNLQTPVLPYTGVVGTSQWQAGHLQFGVTGLTDTAAQRANISHTSVTLTQDQRQSPNPAIPTKHVQFRLTYDPQTKQLLGAQVLADGNIDELINLLALALQAQQTLADLAVADFYMSPVKNDLPHLINAAAMTAYRQEK